MASPDTRLNCWDVTECGRGPDALASERCPAATETRLDGQNGGVNAGRSCWVVNETVCDGEVQGSFSTKLTGCAACPFFKQVVNEEYPNNAATSDMLQLLR